MRITFAEDSTNVTFEKPFEDLTAEDVRDAGVGALEALGQLMATVMETAKEDKEYIARITPPEGTPEEGSWTYIAHHAGKDDDIYNSWDFFGES